MTDKDLQEFYKELHKNDIKDFKDLKKLRLDKNKVEFENGLKVSWKVNPKLDFKETLNSKKPVIKSCEIDFGLEKELKDSDVLIEFEFNSKHYALNSPNGTTKCTWEFSATKRL